MPRRWGSETKFGIKHVKKNFSVNEFFFSANCLHEFFFDVKALHDYFFDSTSFNVKEMQSFAQFNYSTNPKFKVQLNTYSKIILFD